MQHTVRYMFIIVMLVLLPVSVDAAEHEERLDVLHGQLEALSRHVDHILFDLRAQNGISIDPLSVETIDAMISDGISWLKTAQEKEGDELGHFRYEYKPYEGTYTDDDNIVRQAGTFYQMGELARVEGHTHELEESLLRSAEYFTSLTREDAFAGNEFGCIVRHENSDVCKLGATSLALVGLLDLVAAYPEHTEVYEDLIHEYAAFIKAMKNEEAGFRNRFYVDQRLQSSKESSFSVGEAMLALVRYYQFTEDKESKELLLDTFSYINSDAVPFDTPLYLWAMAALRDMHNLWPDKAYITYAKEYTDWRVEGFRNRKLTKYNMCAYVEGVASAHALLKPHVSTKTADSLQTEIDFWLAKTKELQISRDARFRVVPNQDGDLVFKELVEPDRAHGGYLTARDELSQRIDYTQHCLNAYMLHPSKVAANEDNVVKGSVIELRL